MIQFFTCKFGSIFYLILLILRNNSFPMGLITNIAVLPTCFPFSSSSKEKFLIIGMRIAFISVVANLCPIQFLGPAINVKLA